ncbi:MFS transporter [Seiridium cupressi]
MGSLGPHTLFGLVSVSLMLILLPETARSVVGNGGQGKRLKLVGLKRWILLGPDWSSTKYSKTSVDDERPYQPKENSDAQNLAPEKLISRLRRIPNPLSCLSIMLWKDTGLILWLASCNYAVWYCVTASWPQIYTKIYGWNELTIGLAYLPSSITIIAAGFVSGPWSNARYRLTAREAGLPVDGHRVDNFPIERARSRQQWPVFLVTHLGIAGLGWAIHERAHPAILLTVQAVVGFCQSFLFFAFNTLLIHVHPDRPSAASAAASLIRSGFSGVGVAILQPLVDAIGWGWYFTCLALFIGLLQGVGIMTLQKK